MSMSDEERMDMTCSTCIHFRISALEDKPGHLQELQKLAPNKKYGSCRASSPLIIYLGENDEYPYIGVWPLVTELDWCGQWRK